MTREEALAYAISQKAGLESELHRTPCGYGNWAVYSTVLDFINAAISALKVPTREQVEKAWRGEWQVCFEEWQNHRVEGEQCSKCGFQNYGPSNLYNFCPKCGSPITDKAVDMVMERLEEALK